MLEKLGDPEQRILGGSGPVSGDKSLLPAGTLEDLHDQLSGSWRAMGFGSQGEADQFWSAAKVGGAHTSMQVGFCSGSVGDYSVVTQLEIGRW